jgi:hypothetical protein
MDALSTASVGTGAARPRETAPHSARPRETAPDPAREARLAALLRSWWRDERPAWTEESWWDTTLRDDVRRLLWLSPGPPLAAALAEVSQGGPCPVPHDGEGTLPGWPTPGRAPGWPCACQIVIAAAWEACATWVAGRSAAALVTAAGPETVEFDLGEGLPRIEDPAREELAHALRTSIPAMGNRIGIARALTSHPRLVLLVESAAISAWASRLVLDHLIDLDPREADQVIEEIETRIHRRLSSGRRPYHSAEINRLARAARLRICPETATEGRVRAFATRRVTIHPGGDGMATLIAELDAVDAHRIHRRLTAIAAGLETDAKVGVAESRTRDQLRADILTDLLMGAQHQESPSCSLAPGCGPDNAGRGSGPAPEHPADPTTDLATDQADGPRPTCGEPGGARTSITQGGALRPDATRDRTPHAGASPAAAGPEIQVVVTLETLLRLVDDPAQVPGVGPVTADVARVLAADGTWRAWVVDAAGAVTATGARGYVPSAALARLIRAREPRCRFPGCHQPATRCDLDHAVPWPHGPTAPENLGPLCRRHHNLKTHTPWALLPSVAVRGSNGSPAGWRWRTPAGFTITDGPEPAVMGAPLGQRRRTPDREPVVRGPSTGAVAAQDGHG